MIYFVYKIRHKIIESTVNLNLNSEIHNYNTRYRSNYHVQRSRTTISTKNVYVIGLRIFNKLPLGMKNNKSISTFKSYAKIFVHSNLNELECMLN